MLAQIAAAHSGLGIANLPCHVGDTDPLLTRLPKTRPVDAYDMWLLRLRDTRSTARLRVFSEFITEAVENYRELLLGQSG
jgi:DNA-binding transcriptional LysR family regulator